MSKTIVMHIDAAEKCIKYIKYLKCQDNTNETLQCANFNAETDERCMSSDMACSEKNKVDVLTKYNDANNCESSFQHNENDTLDIHSCDNTFLNSQELYSSEPNHFLIVSIGLPNVSEYEIVSLSRDIKTFFICNELNEQGAPISR